MISSNKNLFSRRTGRCAPVIRWILLISLVSLLTAAAGRASVCSGKNGGSHKNSNSCRQDDVKLRTLLRPAQGCPVNGTLEIRARLLSGEQDEKSEGFQSGGFYLLHQNLNETLLDLNLEPVDEKSGSENNKNQSRTLIKTIPAAASSGQFLEAAARVLLAVGDHSPKSGDFFSAGLFYGLPNYPVITSGEAADGENGLLALLIYAKLAETQSVKLETGIVGWRRNTAVCAGHYILFGYGRFGNDILVWEEPVTITPGANIMELDQYNAEVITGF